MGFGAILAGGFCPWRLLEVIKPWHAPTFAAAELAPSMTLVILGAKTLDPKGDVLWLLGVRICKL